MPFSSGRLSLVDNFSKNYSQEVLGMDVNQLFFPFFFSSEVFVQNYKSECESVSCSVVSDCLQPLGLEPARLLCPWNFPGKNTGVGCHSLLQGVFLT